MSPQRSDTPWNRFALENPTFYIATHSRWRWREEDAFWESGKRTVEFIWGECAPHVVGRRRAVEIGCGIGRLAVPMAKRFLELRVVDASPFMLEKLRGRCAQFGCPNVQTYLDTSMWWDQPADFLYSALTFQHIEDDAIIADYIGKISQCLAGAAFLQFDTRPQSFLTAVKARLPEFVFPRTMQPGMRRIRRAAADLRDLFDRHGLAIIRELHPNTELHAFILKKD